MKYRRSKWMINFSLRFFYEFFFEFCLCLMINISTVSSEDGLFYSIGLLFIVGLLSLIAFIVALFFKWGPYMAPRSYKVNSLRDSWWGARHLCPAYKIQEANNSLVSVDV